MAVTNYIDDEKPLYIGTDSDLNITGFTMTKGLANTYLAASTAYVQTPLARLSIVWNKVLAEWEIFSVHL